MPDTRIPASSIVFYQHEVFAEAGEDPTTKLVSMAVKPYNVDAEAADYKTAAWVTAGGRYFAVVMVNDVNTGVGQLTKGIYKSWVKIADPPQTPVLESVNYLVIT